MGCHTSKNEKRNSGETTLKEFRSQTLKAHNVRRKKHGVAGLKLSSDLNSYAQKWADHLLKTSSFRHSDCLLKGKKIGENIATKMGRGGAVDFTGEEVTEQWYSEIKRHNFSWESSNGTGHFTQVVWKESKKLGVGRAKDGQGKVIVVASYSPPGNFKGKFTKNVFPPK